MSRLRSAIALALVGAGAAALAYSGLAFAAAARRGEALTDRAAAALRSPAPSAAAPRAREGDVLGIIGIPAIGLRTAILEGVSDETLLAGPGHVPWSSPPGSGDVSVLAAHRDLHFRGLKDVGAGDRIWLRLPAGRIAYRVTETRVADPADPDVTAPAGTPLLRLVTCWPPSFVGPAPDRLVVTAVPVRPAAAPIRQRAGAPSAAAGLGSLPERASFLPWLGAAGAASAAVAASAAAAAHDRRRWFGAWAAGLVLLDACLALVIG